MTETDRQMEFILNNHREILNRTGLAYLREQLDLLVVLATKETEERLQEGSFPTQSLTLKLQFSKKGILTQSVINSVCLVSALDR